MSLSPPVRFGAVNLLFVLAISLLPIRSAAASPGVNDAPVLDNTKTPELLRIPKGAGVPSGAVGTLVSALVDFTSPTGQLDNVTDVDNAEVDGPALLGIAITAADATNGTWYYSTNGGAGWNLLGAVTASAARTLYADANTRVYFQPTLSTFIGTSTLTIRAWDRTTGTNGGLINSTVNGGSTSLSIATDTAAITVFPSIVFRSATSNATNGISSITLSKPTGTVAGDAMMATLTFTPSTATVSSLPGGWFLVRRIDLATLSMSTYMRIAGGSEPTSYSWVFSNLIAVAGGIMTFDEVDPVNPVVTELGQQNVSSTVHAAPSVTPTISRAMLATWHAYASSGTWTPPAGMTEAVDDMSEPVTGSIGVSLEGNYLSLASGGATGVKSAVASNNADVGAGESIALRPLNYAPYLDATKSPALVPETVGSELPVGAVGTLVSALVDLAIPAGSLDNVVDGDEDALTGVAITGANTTNGTWYYSLDGINWTALGAVSDAAAWLLAADADNRIYFRPNASFSGVLSDAVTFRAWDQTTGSSGTSANVTTNGDATAFSRFSDTASLSVTYVSASPTATNLSAAETYVEDTPLGLIDIVASDVDSPTLTATLTVSNVSAGTLSTATSGAVTSTYSAGTWSASGPTSDVNILLAGVIFTPAPNFNAGFSITTSVSDGTTAPATGTKSVTGTPVNDAPTASNLSAAETYTEDVVRNLVDIVITDVDGPTVTATLTLSNVSAGTLSTATSGAVTSTYNPGTGAWSAAGPVADVNTLLAGVNFMPASNFNGPFSITTSVSDGVASPLNGSKAVTGTAVNDAPTATNLSAAETYTEDVSLNLVDIVASDIDGGTLTASLTVSNPSAGSLSTGTSGPVTSTYNPGTGIWTAAGPLASVNTLLAGVTFTPALNFNGSFFIATSMTDGLASPVTGSKAMTGSAVNDAPTATNLSAAETYTEDTAFGLVDIVAADVDNATLTATLVPSNPSAGSLTTGTSGPVTSTYSAGVWTASGPTANVNTLLAGVSFLPAANFTGSFTIVTSVSDGPLSAGGAKAVTGTAVNDAPSATNLSFPETYTEDVALNLVDILASDVDSPTLTATLTLSNASAGSLNTATSGPVTSTYDTGTGTWSAGGPVANVNTLLAGLTFTPALDLSGPFVIATSLSDGVAAPLTGSKAMTGTPVNDAPTATNLSAAEAYTEDVPLNLVDIVASDVDNGSVTATLTLSNPSAGSLSTGTSGPVTSTYAAGIWTAAGPIANVNVLLGGVVFAPSSDFSASFTIATSLSDGALTTVGTKAMSGLAANDAPSATNLSAPESYTEDTPLDLVDIVASDVDSPSLTATLTLSNNSAGSLSTGTSGPVTSTFDSGTGVWSASGAAAGVNALLAGVTYLPAPDFNAAFTIAASVSDGVAPAATGAKAMSGIAVNDAPLLGDGTLEDVAPNILNPAGQAVSTIFAGQFSDVDADSLAGIAVVTNAADAGIEGSWQYSSNAGVDWFAIGVVDDGPAALAISATSLVRFVPAIGFGGVPAALGVRGLDATYAAAFSTTAGTESRATMNTVPNGGSTAIAATIASLATTVGDVIAAPDGDAPLAFALGEPSPNPSAGGTRFHFAIPQPAHVKLVLFDIRGREVARLADGDYPTGRFQVAWNGQSSAGRVASGIYFARFVTPQTTIVRRVVIAR